MNAYQVGQPELARLSVYQRRALHFQTFGVPTGTPLGRRTGDPGRSE